MATPDRSEDVSSNVENGSCNSNEGTNHETSSDRIANAAKVRKPYTVTKQRERWSEADHERFLEAIKLYGRAWRQIQEHIGTKTAVQIRSHAQKFFTKVAREADSGSDGSVKTVVIPPPRPKRKPLHPYPKKSPIPYAQSPSSNVSAVEKGTKSPTSVLSPFASDDQVNRCSSPNSCTSDIQSNDKKNDYATSEQSFKEDDAVAGSRPTSSIMLFGKIVQVTGEAHKRSSREDHKSTTGLDSRHVETVLSLGVWETSCTGSSAFGSVTDVSENLEKSSESRKPLSSLEKQEPCYRASGFRPYKRCLSEREVTSSLSMVPSEEEGSRRRARVCS